METEEQKKVIDFKNGPVVVIALAGTGKTFSLARRVVKLIESGVEPDEILALTFTNKAAREMKTRVEASLAGGKFNAFTFHGLGYSLFRKFYREMGYSSFKIAEHGSVKNKLIKYYFKGRKATSEEYDEVGKIVDLISKMKKEMGTPSKYFSREWKSAYENMEEDMRESKEITFDDMIYKAVRFLQDSQQHVDMVNSRYKYIIVDEAQDTNKAQFELLYLVNKTNNVMLIGDPSQSIYRFQQARIENIFEFADKFKAEILHLTENFRSTQPIIDVTNTILNHSLYPKKYRKHAHSQVTDGIKPMLAAYETKDDQAISVGHLIERKISQGRIPKDFTILFRNNNHSMLFEKDLALRGIPFVTKSGSYLQRREVSLMIACLKLHDKEFADEQIANYKIVTNNFRGNNVAEKTIALIYLNNKGGEKSFEEVIFDGKKIDGIGPKKKESLEVLAGFSVKVKEAYPKEGTYNRGSALTALRILVWDVIKTNLKPEEDEEDLHFREEALDLFVELWFNYFDEDPEDNSIKGFADSLILRFSSEYPQKEGKQPDAVILSTVHSYKGLENKVVFVTNIKDGMFIRSSYKCGIDKEEYMDYVNLFYVASSRAKEEMFFTFADDFLPWVAEDEQGVSLMKMFVENSYIRGVEENLKFIERPTHFYDQLEIQRAEEVNTPV